MTAFLFPGQGSQIPGMGLDFYEQSSVARNIFNRAATLSPPGFLDMIFHGTAEQLENTRVTQPALLTVETAIAQHLIHLGHVPTVCAGHSLGEISALMAAGVFEFEQVLGVVQARSRYMTDGIPLGGMAAVVGLSVDAIQAALPPGVEVSNFNGPQQTIISGTHEGLEAAEPCLKAAGARKLIRLRVSGPFHSSYMAKAAESFRTEVNTQSFQMPRIPFISSVSGDYVSDPAEFPELIGRQLCCPVLWTSVMQRIGPVRAFEIGPGKVLHGLAKRMEGAPLVELTGTMEQVAALEVGP